jgi:hypothetical protein
MDNSWMISIDGLRLLIDPWLVGPEIDYFSWFNTQYHRTAPVPIPEIGLFDWAVITQSYPDHCHQETLEIIHPSNIFCPASTKSYFDKNYTSSTIISESEYVLKINNKVFKFLRYKSTKKYSAAFDAVLIESENDRVLLAPHGCDDTILSQLDGVIDIDLLVTTSSLYKLPFILGGAINPGIEGLEMLVNKVSPKSIVMTHDENKKASGIVPLLAKVVKYSDEELMEMSFLKNKYKAIKDYKVYDIN